MVVSSNRSKNEPRNHEVTPGNWASISCDFLWFRGSCFSFSSLQLKLEMKFNHRSRDRHTLGCYFTRVANS